MTVLTPAPPAHLWVPPARRGSYLDEVGDVAQLIGRPLDLWGVTAVDALTAYGPGGDWVCLEAVLKMPRQVGKTKGIMLPIALTVSTAFEPMPRLWTAHTEKAYLEAFGLAKELIEGSEEFSRRVRNVREADGDKGIEFVNGSVLDFAVRSSKVGRSRGLPELFMDEALFLKGSFVGALLPTMAAQRNPRVWYFSSAAVASDDGDHLRSLTERGRSGRDETIVLVEHCAPGSWREPGCKHQGCDHSYGTPGCALDDERLWFLAIPSLGFRTSVEFIRAMRRSMKRIPREFGREFLGWDEEPDTATSTPISAEAWAVCEVQPGESREIEGTPALGLDVSPDRRSAAIGLCGRRADGMAQVEVVRHAAGESWVLPEMARAYEAGMRVVAIDGKSQAIAFRTDLEAAGWTVVELAAGDQVEACIGLQRDVLAGDRLRQLGDGILSRALSVATARPVGDGGGWAWARKRSDGDITPLVAVTAAHRALPQVEARTEQSFFGAWR